MVDVEAGLRFDTSQAKVLCRNEECMNVQLELGKIYEVEVVIRADRYNGDQAAYDALARVWREYPNITINYISVEALGPGKWKVVVQMFDPPQAGAQRLAPVWVIAVLVLILAIMFVGYKIGEVTIRALEVLPKAIRELPPEAKALLAAAAALGFAYAIKTLREKR